MREKLKTAWEIVGMMILLAATGLGVAFVLSPKHVDGYYLSQGQNIGSATCVYAHWTWHPDERAFCTDRYADAIDFAAKANATVR